MIRRLLIVTVVIAMTLGSAAPNPKHLPGSGQQITIRFVWSEPKRSPVFDCSDAEIRRKYPAQCPELPFLLGGGGNHPATGGGKQPGIIGRIIGALTGGLL